MNQQKTGSFLKELRKEKCITQEQLAEALNVSNRTVSRWETGSNLPDISMLVELARFYDVDVREIIEGKRKSENMNAEVEEVAVKMADYASEEKSRLLRKMQIVSFTGVLVLLLSIVLQTINITPGQISDRLALYSSYAALIIMAVITLFVTGILEKLVRHKKLMWGIRIATIIGLIVASWRTIAAAFVVSLLLLSFVAAPIEVYDDISDYEEYMSFSDRVRESAGKSQWTKFGLDETIWPAQITDSMTVADFKMVYYNPWDAQYLGYLVVDYTPEEYEDEVRRLKEYASTEYIGYYCVEEEKTYELLAVNADEYHGFVYALTDGKGRIIYAEQLFCNYFMDLDYNEYIPREYLLDGFDATNESSYYHGKTDSLKADFFPALD